jgi:hypothetical protein
MKFICNQEFYIEITHAIKRYVKLGYEIASGKDIEMAIKDLSGTHVANLQPNREQGKYFFVIML